MRGSSRRSLLAAALLVPIAVFLLVRRPAPVAGPSGPGAPGEGAEVRTPEPRAPAPEASRLPPPADSAPALEVAASQRAERVSQALELLRYPPDSQPLRPAMLDVLQPNRRFEAALPLAVATGRTGEAPREGDLSFLLTGDVFVVLGPRALVATLEVFREPAARARERVRVDVTRCSLAVVEAAGSRVVAEAAVPNDEGRDGDAHAADQIYSVVVRPSALPALRASRGLVRLEVDFMAQDGERRPAHASLDFRIAPAAPAWVAGVASERLTPDGLELALDLRVDEPGHYFLQGLLFDAQGAPLGFAVARPRLAAGRATVPLLFWGLLFREAKATGPFLFRTVTGHRLPDPGAADRADMDTWEGVYTTQPYAASDFSDKEYESASKDLKVQALAALAARNPARAAAPLPRSP